MRINRNLQVLALRYSVIYGIVTLGAVYIIAGYTDTAFGLAYLVSMGVGGFMTLTLLSGVGPGVGPGDPIAADDSSFEGTESNNFHSDEGFNVLYAHQNLLRSTEAPIRYRVGFYGAGIMIGSAIMLAMVV